jgi:hypothetical protein
MPRGYPAKIQHAFDEIRFGATRTLNLRESLPSSDEAKRRTEQWLRAKQVERAGEVLVITGRGKNSEGGRGVIRAAILALFPSLRRRNIIEGWQEHTAGSFVVTLAPMRALFEAPKRRRERGRPVQGPPSLAALQPNTLASLRQLAIASLAVLGVYEYEPFLESEMLAKFAALSEALPSDADDPDVALQAMIRQALNELDDL